MNIIRLHENGAELRDRATAKSIRTALPAGSPVIFDFEGVKMMTSSFCDELIGILYTQLGNERFAKMVSFQNLDADLKPIVLRSLVIRKTATLHP